MQHTLRRALALVLLVAVPSGCGSMSHDQGTDGSSNDVTEAAVPHDAATDSSADGSPEPMDASDVMDAARDVAAPPDATAMDSGADAPALPDAAPDVVSPPDVATVDAAPDAPTCTGTLCSGACVDLATDTANCGACSHACPAGNACVSGTCTLVCAAPTQHCGSTCVDTSTDDANCGACSHACTGGTHCASSACACPAGQQLCGGTCVDTSTDAHCGACGTSCTGGTHCTSGACTCPAGQQLCGGACVDTSTDAANCGACGTACTAPANGTATCGASACHTACNAGYAPCAAGCCQVLRALSVSAGGDSTCAVMTDHTLYCWGDNTNSKLGLGDHTPRTTPTRVTGISDVASVSVGGYGTCAVTTSGRLYCWGSSDTLPFVAVGEAATPTLVDDMETMSAVSMGATHGCVLDNRGWVGCFGSNFYDQAGGVGWHGAPNVHTINNYVEVYPAAAVVAGSQYSCAARRDGQVLCWGQSMYGQLGTPSVGNVVTPTAVPNQRGPYVGLVSGLTTTVAVTATGRVDCWGTSTLGQCGVVSPSPGWTSLVTVAGLDGTGGIAAEQGSVFAWGTSGSVSCIGSRNVGQCGDGSSIGYGAMIVPVNSLSAPLRSLDGGSIHTCAVDAAGVVWCWGYNHSGQLGNGTTIDATTPVRVSGF